MKKIIGIVANEVPDGGEKIHNLPIIYTPAGYVKAVQNAGGLPIIIPMGQTEDVELYVNQIDKLILTGGQNVHPSYYGEPLKTTIDSSYKRRDAFEIALVKEVIRQQKPIFAVCRGMQLLNVSQGGSINQELSQLTQVEHMQNTPHEESSHGITTLTGSNIATVYGDQKKSILFTAKALIA